jgi:tetratricopeptide (TPR) repeat protein
LSSRLRSAIVLAIVAAGAVASSPAQTAQSADYRAILEQYRRGEFEAAVSELARLPGEERYRQARALIETSLRPFRSDIVEAMLALHSEVAWASRSPLMCSFSLKGRLSTTQVYGETLFRERSPYFEFALTDAIKKRQPGDAFLRQWYIAAISYAHRWSPGGWDCYQSAPPAVQRTPDMQLALGAMHEKTWHDVRDERMRIEIMTPSLEEAERAYRAALASAPDLAEAQLRLGRVLALRGKPDAALAEFGRVRDRLDGGFAYLVRLFEGGAHEQRGDADRARALYEEAHAMMPRAQSAVSALVQLAFMQGRRAESLEYTTLLNTAEAHSRSIDPWQWKVDGADPWSWYSHGTNWRFPAYLAQLRALVKPPS